MTEIEVVTVIDGALYGTVEWPTDWPLPRVGEDVDTGDAWFVVTGVVWHPSGTDCPYVSINLTPATDRHDT